MPALDLDVSVSRLGLRELIRTIIASVRFMLFGLVFAYALFCAWVSYISKQASSARPELLSNLLSRNIRFDCYQLANGFVNIFSHTETDRQ